ncbi:tryptophan--tRNA ligase [Candidatus Woesearchaeota archaeon]|nr:tryptophan--tRNA ligase [Candidatus Woesearchaeota archaeon]
MTELTQEQIEGRKKEIADAKEVQESLLESNKKLVNEFGAGVLKDIIDQCPNFYTFQRGLIYTHRDFDQYMQAIKKRKKVAIVSGVNASGKLHIGHKIVFDTNLYFQKEYDIPVFIPISDDESYVAGKVKTQEEGLKNSLILAKELLAYGFDPHKTFFIIDQIFTNVYNFAIKLSRGTTMSALRAVYGYNMEDNCGLFFYPAVQSAHILMPQLKEHGGHDHVLVPIGPDEDAHIRIGRDLAPKFGLVKPAILHAFFIPGLKGGKMSTTDPGSAIFLEDDPKTAKAKIMKAKTGGRETADLQKKYGADFEICMVYKYLELFYLRKDEILDLQRQCKGGGILCGECKKRLASHVEEDLKDFQERLEKVKDETVQHCILRNV